MTTPAVKAVRPPGRRLRRWPAVAAALGVLALGGFIGWPWFRDWAELRAALKLAEDNHFDEALPVLLRFHERHPQNVVVVRALAMGYYDARQLPQTERFLDRWCELAPGETAPYRQRLNFWMMQKEVSRAITDAGHILRLDRKDFETRGKLVELLLTDGRYEQAEQEGLRCFREHPKDVELWLILANIYRGLGQAAKAADLTDQVLRVSPDHLAALKFRAKLYVEAGQPEPAIRLLKERVVGKNSQDEIQGLYELSDALVRAGREDEAKRVLAELDWRLALGLWSKYEHRDDNPGLQERVVMAMLAAGKTDDATRFLTDILQRNPKAPPRTHRLLARCYEKQGQPERAAEQRAMAERKQGDKEKGRQADKETK